MFKTLYISKSRIRRDILALYFTNPSQKYYLRELERLLSYSAGNLRRELLRFQKDHLFITQKVGNLLYYSLNPEHPLFEELKSIVSKTIGVEGSIRKALSRIKKIKTAFIFGSYAAGSEKERSDIDVLIIGDPDLMSINEKICELENKLKREINITVYSESEYREKKKSKNGFITDLIKSPKIMLVGTKNDL